MIRSSSVCEKPRGSNLMPPVPSPRTTQRLHPAKPGLAILVLFACGQPASGIRDTAGDAEPIDAALRDAAAQNA